MSEVMSSNERWIYAFRDKKVVVTGHTGFKGSWLVIWLKLLGAKVYGISNSELSENSLYNTVARKYIDEEQFFDICETSRLQIFFSSLRPDFVFHLAAQALVKEGYADPHKTFATNASGTVSVLTSLTKCPECTLVSITSDKVYENFEWCWGYRETDILGGKDPYSASKSMAELALRSFYESFLADGTSYRLGIARAGNVIGGGDWSENRIVPDCVRAWSRGCPVSIRNPDATRPWQHVLVPLSGYLKLASQLKCDPTINGNAFNFGPSDASSKSVVSLIREMRLYWESNHSPPFLVEASDWGEAQLLQLNVDKARAVLGWEPLLDFKQTIKLTMEWYVCFFKERHLLERTTISQIENFQKGLTSTHANISSQ